MNDLAGKAALVTGGTSGIGRAVALALAGRGADVTVVGRNRERGEATVREMRARGAANASFLWADFAEMAAVRSVAAQFRAAHDALHILVHSAGAHHFQRTRTADGIEYNFATNYLSKFLLTDLLHDRLIAAAPARIVVVGSPMVNPGRFLRLDGVRGKRRAHPVRALLISGLATGVWTATLARRLDGTGVTINNVNPGMVDTGIVRDWPAPLRLFNTLMAKRFGLSAEEGAQAPLYLATADAVAATNGAFFRQMRRVSVPPGTYDRELGARLWAFSEHLVAAAATPAAASLD